MQNATPNAQIYGYLISQSKIIEWNLGSKFSWKLIKKWSSKKSFRVIPNDLPSIQHASKAPKTWFKVDPELQNWWKSVKLKINTENEEIWRNECWKQYAFALQSVLHGIALLLNKVSSKIIKKMKFPEKVQGHPKWSPRHPGRFQGSQNMI